MLKGTQPGNGREDLIQGLDTRPRILSKFSKNAPWWYLGVSMGVRERGSRHPHSEPEHLCFTCSKIFDVWSKGSASRNWLKKHTKCPVLSDEVLCLGKVKIVITIMWLVNVYIYKPFISVFICVYIQTYTHIFIYTFKYTYIYVYINTYIPCICTHTYSCCYYYSNTY